MKTKMLSLPITRRGQIKFILRTNLSLIFKLSLLLFPFSIPLFSQLIYLLVGIGPILSNAKNTAYEKLTIICNLIKVISLFNPISFLCLSIGFVGAINILKKIIYNDGFSFWYAFGQGIKEGKQALVLNTILGLLVSLWNLGIFSFGKEETIAWFIVFMIVNIAVLLIVVSLFVYQCLFPIYYSGSILQVVKNSFIFSFHTLGVVSGLFLLGNMFFLLPYIIDFILFSRITYLTITGLFLELLFFGVFTLLLIQLYAVSRFDEVINQNNYPDMYRKGLYDLNGDNEDEW